MNHLDCRFERSVSDAIKFWSKCGRAIRTAVFLTDYRRWELNARQKPSWDQRNVCLADYIPSGCSVIDMGSGAQTLRKHLKPGCRYQPCDLIQSTPDCLLCDFNRGRYPDTREVFDFVVCSGVFEYMRSPSDFLRRISRYGKTILMTFCPWSGHKRDVLGRISKGWVNHLTMDALGALFTSTGLEYEIVGRWRGQLIYRISAEHTGPRQ
jgi:hypothetical protein